jgi:hypothetical protein
MRYTGLFKSSAIPAGRSSREHACTGDDHALMKKKDKKMQDI